MSVSGNTSAPGSSVGNPDNVRIEDGASTALATVAQFHNADNQVIGSGNGLLTGGVAQLLNPPGNLDRARETGFDNISAAGVPAGTQQVAGPLLSTTANNGAAITGSANAQNVILTAVSFTNRGVTASFQAGTTLLVEPGGANQEYVFLTAVNTSTLVVTGIFAKNHAANVTVQAFAYNQARDATISDGSTPAGIAASATYLFNSTSNAGAGGVEFERSAAGELDGATGTGTNIAAEYEFNSGGPVTNSGAVTGLSFDRARNLQGKGFAAATQNAGGAAGATSITVSSATAVKTLNAGQQIWIDRNTGNSESAYTATNYVPGTALITLQTALQFTHAAATVEWDIFSAVGPGLNGFTPTGIGIEEEALYNPVDTKYYIERSATQDSMPAANIVAESLALWNGATMDRATGSLVRGMDVNLKANNTQVGGTAVFINGLTNAVVSLKANNNGNLYQYSIANTNNVMAYVQLFNVATPGGVALGTTTPNYVIPVPPNGVTDGPMPVPYSFSAGLQWAATTTPTGSVALTNALSASALYA